MIRDENLQTGTNSAINYDRMLSPVVLEVIQNDAAKYIGEKYGAL